MRLGATLAHLSPAPPFAIAERAKRLVDGGFDSLRVPQVFGRGFWVADPFVTPAVAATATEGVEPGTATLQVPLHHPAELAHRVLSLASVCGDRLTLGVSPGSTWQPGSSTAGSPPATAAQRTRSSPRTGGTGRRAGDGRWCAPSRCGAADLAPTGELLHRFAESGFDDALVLIEPQGPDP